MTIIDGINLGVGLWLSLPVLAILMILGSAGIGLIAYPFIYSYRKLKNKKEVK